MHARHQQAVQNGAGAGMAEQGKRDDQQAGEDEDVHEALPVLEAAGERHCDQRQGCDRDNDITVETQILERQRDTDELRQDGQEVEHEERSDRVGAPGAAEALENEPGVPNAGDGAQPDDHLLVDDHDDDQQGEHPEQAGAVVLSGLRVGRDTAGVVVADHDDQSRAHDREQRL